MLNRKRISIKGIYFLSYCASLNELVSMIGVMELIGGYVEMRQAGRKQSK